MVDARVDTTGQGDLAVFLEGLPEWFWPVVLVLAVVLLGTYAGRKRS